MYKSKHKYSIHICMSVYLYYTNILRYGKKSDKKSVSRISTKTQRIESH